MDSKNQEQSFLYSVKVYRPGKELIIGINKLWTYLILPDLPTSTLFRSNGEINITFLKHKAWQFFIRERHEQTTIEKELKRAKRRIVAHYIPYKQGFNVDRNNCAVIAEIDAIKRGDVRIQLLKTI